MKTRYVVPIHFFEPPVDLRCVFEKVLDHPLHPPIGMLYRLRIEPNGNYTGQEDMDLKVASTDWDDCIDLEGIQTIEFESVKDSEENLRTIIKWLDQDPNWVKTDE